MSNRKLKRSVQKIISVAEGPKSRARKIAIVALGVIALMSYKASIAPGPVDPPPAEPENPSAEGNPS